MATFKITMTESPNEEKEFIMPVEELKDFQKYLNKAVLEMFKAQPENPKQFLALALCRSIGLNSADSNEFPELQSLLVSPNETPQLLSPARAYPEGVQIKRRGSVVGESGMEEELTQDLPVFEKSLELQETLKEILRTNVLFSHIDDTNLTNVVKSLESLRFQTGEIVVKQNEEGSSCYFVQSGQLSCFVEERGYVEEYGPGSSFGEASIMYGNLRGATIQVIKK